MRAKAIGIILALVIALLGLRYMVDVLESTEEIPAVSVSAPEARPVVDIGNPGGWQKSPSTPVQIDPPISGDDRPDEATSEELIRQYGFDPAKIAALRAARDGDPRTPPIERGPERVLPTPEELADPSLYLEYEERQHKQLLAGFVKAAGPKIEQLKRIIAEGRRRQMSEEDIAVAEEKIQKLEAMRAELLGKNPELADIETPLLDLSQFSQDEQE